MRQLRSLVFCFALLAITACMTTGPALTEQNFNSALQYCDATVSDSVMGSCLESQITSSVPNWTQDSRAPYLATLFSYMNVVGSKVDSGEWNDEQATYEMQKFMNRMKIQMASQDRIRSQNNMESAVDSFVRGMNSGITCIAYTPQYVRCR